MSFLACLLFLYSLGHLVKCKCYLVLTHHFVFTLIISTKFKCLPLTKSTILQQSSESEFQHQPIKNKPAYTTERVKDEPIAGWPSFGQLITDLSKLAFEFSANTFFSLLPFHFKPDSSKHGLTPLKDSLKMPEDEIEPPLIHKQRVPSPITTTEKYSEIKPQKLKSSSFNKESSMSSKHRSSKRHDLAEFYGSGEVPRSKSQKERSRHRQRDKNGEVVFGAVGSEPKPVEIKPVNYDDTKFNLYNIRNKYGSDDSFRF